MTWNPESFEISDSQWNDDIQRISEEGHVTGRWSAGNTKAIRPGDVAYLIRYSSDKGILARGIVASEVYQDDHWGDGGRLANYVDIRWLEQVHLDDRLTFEELEKQLPDETWIRYSSGSSVKPEFAAQLAELWESALARSGYLVAEEFKTLAAPDVCAVCNFNFGAAWGERGLGLLAPSADGLVVICWNCKKLIDDSSPPLTWSEARAQISSQL
jgi:hypothetical protein